MTRVHAATAAAAGATKTGGASAVSFLPLTLTTITFTGVYVISEELPIEAIRAAMHADPSLAREVGLDPCDGATTKRKRRDAFVREVSHEKRRFRNQLTVAFGGKSAKLFYNGSLHVTGCTSAIDMADIASRVASMVFAYIGIHITLESMNVRMINAGTVSVNPATLRPVGFPPRRLSKAMDLAVGAGRDDVFVDFDPERHPGVKLTIGEGSRRVATVYTFQTGSVSIIGARDPSSMALAFETVAAALGTCDFGTESDRMRTTTAKKTLELIEGYPAVTYWACAS